LITSNLISTKLLFQDPSVHDASQPVHPPVDDGFNPFAHQQQPGETKVCVSFTILARMGNLICNSFYSAVLL